MGATLNDRITLELMEEIAANPNFSISDLMQRYNISKDKARKLWGRIARVGRKLHYKIVPDPQKNASSIEKKVVKPNPYTPNTPEWSNRNQLEQGDVTIEEIFVRSYLLCSPDKIEKSDALVKMPDTLAKISDALDTVSMPWLPGNNWKSMVLRKKDPCGKTVLHLLQLDPFELKEDIETILFAINEINCPEETKKPEPIPPVIKHRPLLRRNFIISDQCPYKNKNKTYAVIWQILKKFHFSHGIRPEFLKKQAMKITGKSSKTIDKAIAVVISPRNSNEKGRDKRALRGYWVERSENGRLILHLPVNPQKEDPKSVADPNQRLLL